MTASASSADCTATVAASSVSQHDQGEQPVALGDVLRVPRGHPGPLGPDGHGQLGGGQDQEADPPGVLARQGEEGDPADLHHADAEGVAQARRPVGRVAAGRPEPLVDQGKAHHHVAEGHGAEVAVERPWHPGGQDQHPGDLDQRGQPVGVVVVVGGGEPGEVHPRPPDGEEHRQVPEHRVGHVTVGDAVCRLADAWATATTKHGSKNSSSAVALRCSSSGLRATIGRRQCPWGSGGLMAA